MNSRRGFLQTIAAAIVGSRLPLPAFAAKRCNETLLTPGIIAKESWDRLQSGIAIAHAYRDHGHAFYRLPKIGDTITVRKPARFR